MGSFAAYLKRQGVEVTGSDQNIYPPMSDVLKDAGVPVFLGYDPENIKKCKPDLVIVGNVIRKTNLEMQAVIESGIEYQSLPQALENFVLPGKDSIVIAGTHGKTTTSSMAAFVFEKLQEKPSYFIGGVPADLPDSFRIEDSKFMILEGDEYDTAFFDKVPKFTHYRPKEVILTSVEFDHADIYPDITAVIKAFENLAAITDPTGHFIACAETETPLRVAQKSRAKVVTYGFGAGADHRAKSLVLTGTGSDFSWRDHKVHLRVPGRHNALNALSCLALVHELGLDEEEAVEALRNFHGVKRRQEVYAKLKGITLIDDFAHHPTAVRETLLAMKCQYSQNRIVACFEPRSATSRRRIFQQAYAESFDMADLVFLAKPYDQTGIDPKEQFSTQELLSDLKERGKKADVISTDEKGVQKFVDGLRSGDVVLVMSNGGFDGLLPRLVSKLT